MPCKKLSFLDYLFLIIKITKIITDYYLILNFQSTHEILLNNTIFKYIFFWYFNKQNAFIALKKKRRKAIMMNYVKYGVGKGNGNEI